MRRSVTDDRAKSKLNDGRRQIPSTPDALPDLADKPQGVFDGIDVRMGAVIYCRNRHLVDTVAGCPGFE
jgi:hypothetical protein